LKQGEEGKKKGGEGLRRICLLTRGERGEGEGGERPCKVILFLNLYSGDLGKERGGEGKGKGGQMPYYLSPILTEEEGGKGKEEKKKKEKYSSADHIFNLSPSLFSLLHLWPRPFEKRREGKKRREKKRKRGG